MEKMDQTRTDCNLTRMGFPGETPLFFRHIFPVFLVFSGYHLCEKICHRLFVGW
jgi:hypothetical protein